GDLSKGLILDKSIIEECEEIIQNHHINKNLKWVISENSVPSLNKWVENEEEFIHVIYDNEMLENRSHAVKEVNDDVAHTKELNYQQPNTQRIQKTALLQAKSQVPEYILGANFQEIKFKENINISKQTKKRRNSPKPVGQANFVYTKLSSYNVKNRSLKERRILANLEIKRLLDKLGSINPSLANEWYQFFHLFNNYIEIIESSLKYLDNIIFYKLSIQKKKQFIE
ncbi:3975_t:CDS:2, partial [Gigaspora margarita]